MTTRHREPFSAPVQLESLLEVPCKIILIEDLIREKAALASSESTSLECSTADNKEDDEENNRREGDRKGLSGKKCLFDCCATPSRWRDTESYSNSSQFRTAGISLPWQESLAVIPVMQVEKRKFVDVSPINVAGEEVGTTHEDAGSDVEISNTVSDEEKGDKGKVPSNVTPPPLISPSKCQQTLDNSNNKNSNTDKDINLPKQSQSISDPKVGQESAAPKNLQQVEASSSSSKSSSPPAVGATLEVSTVASAAPSPVLLGKVTEKPTRYEDFIIAQCSNTSNSSNNGSNTITCRKEPDVIREADTASQGSNNSADDTIKLTFYNKGIKEFTKEFRPAGNEIGGTSSSSNDIRYFENQGLQMSRVIRELGSNVGSEGNARLRQHQQPVEVESTEINKTNSSVCNDDNTQNYSKNLNDNANVSSSIANLSAAASSQVITQPQQLRLTSSIIQNLACNIGTPNSNAIIGNMSSNINTSTASEQSREWEGLQISRCQKDLSNNNVITLLDGENDNGSLSSREINNESSLITATAAATRPSENDKGESENSIERHLQTYLTSLRYVKPAESGNERIGGQEADASKGRSPAISPQSRHVTTNIISPVISPHTRSPGVVASAVRMSNIQRVSPSQQAVSLESWPERTIARIPTRPFVRRNTNFEQQQDPKLMQPRPSYHPNNPNVQQQKLIPTVVPTGMGTTSIMAPMHSPPKRFKTAANIHTTSSMLPHSHSLQQQQQQQQQQLYHHQQGHNVPNRFSNINNATPLAYQTNRSNNSDHHPPHNMPQQQQHQHSASSNSNLDRIPNIQQQLQQYSNVQSYNNQRPSSVQRPASATVGPNTNQSHHSQSVAQIYSQHQSQDHQYHAKYPTNSSSSSQSQQQQQQQLQQFRHIQESLLIASSGTMGSTSEPVDKSYSERLRRYCEYYHRQELDVTKLHEYYKKYGFYPWDILTARDESIIRQRKNQEQQQQQQQQQQLHTVQHAEVRESHNTNMTRYDSSARQVHLDSGTIGQYHQQQLQHQRQFPSRTVNLVTSPTRATSNFSSPSQPTAVPGSAQAGITTASRVVNISPPVAPTQATTPVQNRYNNNVHSQQLQQIQQVHQRDYVVQQRTNNRYYQTEQQQHDQQNYHQNELQQQQQQQQQQQIRTVERCGNVPPPTNFDVQSSPHYRSAYNQLAAAAAAAVSSVANNPAAVVQNQLRSNDVRIATIASKAHPPTRDDRINLLHSQSGVGIRPVVMTVSDPVPAPPEAIPLSIHRQALEQAIKNNQVAAGNTTSMYHPTNANRDYVNFRRDQRQSLHTPPSLPQHAASSSIQMPSHHGQSYVAIGSTGGVHSTTNKEPLRVAPSPTLPHQTSVIRRIQQQQDTPPTAVTPFTAGTSRHVSNDRPGISYRRVSDGNSDSNSGVVGVPLPSTAFLYQQHKDGRNIHSSMQHQSHYHSMTNPTAQHSGATNATPATPVRRNILPNESLQGISRGPQKRRIIITDNNGINQNISDMCPVVVASSPVPLIAGEEEVVTANMSPSAIRSTLSEELPDDDDRMDSIGGAGWQYDHVVLLDKRIKTYMCKRCFETLKTEQQIRNHLFCKMLANHVQCHVCLQLVTSDTYPAHLQIHGVRPPDNIQIEN